MGFDERLTSTPLLAPYNLPQFIVPKHMVDPKLVGSKNPSSSIVFTQLSVFECILQVIVPFAPPTE